MRKRHRSTDDTPFPVTLDDLRNARHDEDPADVRNPGDVNRTLEAQGFTTEEPYNRLNLYKR